MASNSPGRINSRVTASLIGCSSAFSGRYQRAAFARGGAGGGGVFQAGPAGRQAADGDGGDDVAARRGDDDRFGFDPALAEAGLHGPVRMVLARAQQVGVVGIAAPVVGNLDSCGGDRGLGCGIRGWTERIDATSEEKIEWLRDTGWLFDVYLKHESMRLLAVSLP